MATGTDRPATAGLPVLMYHALGTPMPAPLAALSVPPRLLAEQLSAVAEAGYELLGLTAALAAHADGRRVAALTFDDGYLDFATTGVPTLRARSAGATLYLPSRHLGGRAAWLPGPAAGLGLLAPEQVREVVDAGVEIGSHGARHVPLDVEPPALVATELRESRDRLEALAGRPIDSFCYPHGYHSRRLRELVRATGYRNACTIGHRVHPAGGDPWAVSRILVGPHHRPEELAGMLRTGVLGWRPRVTRLATPAWRAARRVTLRGIGVRLT